MKTNIQVHPEATTFFSHTTPLIDGNSSELGSQAPCIGDDPHETNRLEF